MLFDISISKVHSITIHGVIQLQILMLTMIHGYFIETFLFFMVFFYILFFYFYVYFFAQFKIKTLLIYTLKDVSYSVVVYYLF